MEPPPGLSTFPAVSQLCAYRGVSGKPTAPSHARPRSWVSHAHRGGFHGQWAAKLMPEVDWWVS
jgi:hypothetical protein